MKVNKTLLITAGCAVVVGAAMAGVAATRLINTHAVTDTAVTRNITEKITRLDISSDYGDINVVSADTDKITVDYIECDMNKYDITTADGKLKIAPMPMLIAKNWRDNWFDHIFTFDIHRHGDYTIKVTVPKNTEFDSVIQADAGRVSVSELGGNLTVNSDFGYAEVLDSKLKKLDCEMDYGGLKIDSVTAENINIKSDCGDIELNDVSANVNADCDYGAIRFDRLQGKILTLDCDCGDIKGTIVGKETDYTIDADTEYGKNNLTNRAGGQNTLTVKTDMGSIDIKFTE